MRWIAWLGCLVCVCSSAPALAAARPGLGPELDRPIYAGSQPGFPFVVRRGHWAAAFGPEGAAFNLPQGDGTRLGVRWRLVGAATVAPVPEQPLPVLVSEFAGPDHVRAGLPGHRDVRWRDALRGVDLVFRSQTNALEWLLEARVAGAPERRFTVEVEGVDAIVQESTRALRLVVGRGALLESGLACRQDRPDRAPREVACRYGEVRQVAPLTWRYTVEASGLDPLLPLAVDPSFFWSVSFGGSRTDTGKGLCLLPDGYAIGGQTASADMPPTGRPGARSDEDAYVTRLSKELKLSQVLYVGKSGTEAMEAMACGRDALYLTGSTTDATIATVGDLSLAGPQDAYLAKVAFAGGLGVEGITLIGDELEDLGRAVSVAPDQNSVVVAGLANGNVDIGVWSVPADLTLASRWSLQVRGDGDDMVKDVVATAAGAHLVGNTKSTSFQLGYSVEGLHTTRPKGATAAFAMGVGPTTSGAEVRHYTWIGAGGNDSAEAILTDGTNLFIGGTLTSSDFTVLGPVFDPAVDADSATGESEGFVAKLRRTTGSFGWAWDWKSALGGPGMKEGVNAMGWFGSDLVVVGHLTGAANGFEGFPGLVDHGTSPGGAATDFFVARVSSDGTTVHSRVFASSGTDTPHAVAVPDGGSWLPIVVAGTTDTIAFPHLRGDAGVADLGARLSFNPFVLATDVTPPKLTVIDSDGTSTTADVDYTNGNGIYVAWTVEEPEDDQRRLEVWYAASLPDGGCSATSYPKATVDLPGVVVEAAPPFLYVPASPPQQGAKLYAVVKVTNSTGLSDLACSDGIFVGWPDGGQPGLDASRPDAATAEDAASSGPDAGLAESDAGAEDAGVEAPDAELLRADASPVPDASGPDAGASDTGGGRPPGALGWSCDCSSAAGGAWAWLACLPLVALRRRRSAR